LITSYRGDLDRTVLVVDELQTLFLLKNKNPY
jgi:hypothetical protein